MPGGKEKETWNPHRYVTMSHIGSRTGVDVLAGKKIRVDEHGNPNFDDYFTESEHEDSADEIIARYEAEQARKDLLKGSTKKLMQRPTQSMSPFSPPPKEPVGTGSILERHQSKMHNPQGSISTNSTQGSISTSSLTSSAASGRDSAPGTQVDVDDGQDMETPQVKHVSMAEGGILSGGNKTMQGQVERTKSQSRKKIDVTLSAQRPTPIAKPVPQEGEMKRPLSLVSDGNIVGSLSRAIPPKPTPNDLNFLQTKKRLRYTESPDVLEELAAKSNELLRQSSVEFKKPLEKVPRVSKKKTSSKARPESPVAEVPTDVAQNLPSPQPDEHQQSQDQVQNATPDPAKTELGSIFRVPVVTALAASGDSDTSDVEQAGPWQLEFSDSDTEHADKSAEKKGQAKSFLIPQSPNSKQRDCHKGSDSNTKHSDKSAKKKRKSKSVVVPQSPNTRQRDCHQGSDSDTKHGYKSAEKKIKSKSVVVSQSPNTKQRDCHQGSDSDAKHSDKSAEKKRKSKSVVVSQSPNTKQRDCHQGSDSDAKHSDKSAEKKRKSERILVQQSPNTKQRDCHQGSDSDAKHSDKSAEKKRKSKSVVVSQSPNTKQRDCHQGSDSDAKHSDKSAEKKRKSERILVQQSPNTKQSDCHQEVQSDKVNDEPIEHDAVLHKVQEVQSGRVVSRKSIKPLMNSTRISPTKKAQEDLSSDRSIVIGLADISEITVKKAVQGANIVQLGDFSASDSDENDFEFVGHRDRCVIRPSKRSSKITVKSKADAKRSKSASVSRPLTKSGPVNVTSREKDDPETADIPDSSPKAAVKQRKSANAVGKKRKSAVGKKKSALSKKTDRFEMHFSEEEEEEVQESGGAANNSLKTNLSQRPAEVVGKKGKSTSSSRQTRTSLQRNLSDDEHCRDNFSQRPAEVVGKKVKSTSTSRRTRTSLTSNLSDDEECRDGGDAKEAELNGECSEVKAAEPAVSLGDFVMESEEEDDLPMTGPTAAIDAETDSSLHQNNESLINANEKSGMKRPSSSSEEANIGGKLRKQSSGKAKPTKRKAKSIITRRKNSQSLANIQHRVCSPIEQQDDENAAPLNGSSPDIDMVRDGDVPDVSHTSEAVKSGVDSWSDDPESHEMKRYSSSPVEANTRGKLQKQSAGNTKRTKRKKKSVIYKNKNSRNLSNIRHRVCSPIEQQDDENAAPLNGSSPDIDMARDGDVPDVSHTSEAVKSGVDSWSDEQQSPAPILAKKGKRISFPNQKKRSVSAPGVPCDSKGMEKENSEPAVHSLRYSSDQTPSTVTRRQRTKSKSSVNSSYSIASVTDVSPAAVPASSTPAGVLKKQVMGAVPGPAARSARRVSIMPPPEHRSLSESAVSDGELMAMRRRRRSSYYNTSAYYSMSQSPVHIYNTTSSVKPEMYRPDTKRSKIIHPSINESGLRRSQRTRVQPVEWYRGERVAYRRTSLCYVVDGITSPHEDDDEWRHKLNPQKVKKLIRKREKKQNKGAPKSRRLSTHVELEPELLEESDHAIVINPETNQEVSLACFKKKEDYKFVGPGGQTTMPEDRLVLCKSLKEQAFSTGQLVLRPREEKGTQYVRNDTMIFVVKYGKVAVTIHQTPTILSTDDTFYVPRGNTYNIRNLRNDEASLWFTQLKG